MTADATQPELPAPSGRVVIALLLLAAIVGVVVSLAAWGFLELIHQIEVGVFSGLPHDLGYDDAPVWWPLPVLAIAGLVIAFAIVRLPGGGGHVPANGLATAPTQPIDLPGVMLAALATIGLGLVLGPEAPLIALGSGLGFAAVRLVRSDSPEQMQNLVAAAGTFAALSFIFGSPIIGAVILIEAAGLDKRRMTAVLIPGLLAAGIGSLVSIGMGSWTGLSSSAWALSPLSLPGFDQPDAVDFVWTIPLAIAVALGCLIVVRVAQKLNPLVMRRAFLLLPLAGLVVAGLAIAFEQSTDKGAEEVLFSGQDQLPGLTANAATWSVSALALVLIFKGVAWSISLASFRGGPTFPAVFLGAAGGLLASHLPGFATTPAVGVGIAAAVVAVLRLPLSAVVLATLLTAKTGPGSEPLIILGVVVAHLTAVVVTRRTSPEDEPPAAPERPPAEAEEPRPGSTARPALS
jgi:H+/Cl- antiporter ClcA